MIISKIVHIAAVTSVTGAGITVAQTDINTNTTVLIAAIASLIAGIAAAIQTVMNTRAKNRQEEIKLDMEKLKMQMQHQKELSTFNQHSLQSLHTAVAQNTMETVKSANAADQVKVRVEQIEKNLPVQKSEISSEVTVVNPPSDPVNTTPVSNRG